MTRVSVCLLALLLLAGCDTRPNGGAVAPAHEEGRLSARPQEGAPRGEVRFGTTRFGPDRRGILFVPRTYEPSRPAALALVLHGAGGNGVNAVQRMQPLARRAGALVLGVISSAPTWDYVLGGYGPDVAFIDAALRRVFRAHRVDPRRVGVAGFSDGATYALSLGITNGELLRHVVAFSPGFADLDNPHGSPDVFITHGISDRTLPIDQTSRELVPELKEMGLAVRYEEFPGGHEIPDHLYPQALAWLREK